MKYEKPEIVRMSLPAAAMDHDPVVPVVVA